MDASSFRKPRFGRTGPIALMAILVIVGLFVTLFLQGAYVRYRLLDVERSRMSIPDDVACPDIDNGARSYALLLDCCKTRSMNSGPRLPKAVTSSGDVDLTTTTSKPLWLAVNKTTTSTQLYSDVASGRVKYLLLGGRVARIATPNMHEYFTETERATLNVTWVIFSVSAAFAPGELVVLPWTQEATYTEQGIDAYVSRACGDPASNTTCGNRVLVHCWAYGVSASAVS